jgi:hypothetical protein
VLFLDLLRHWVIPTNEELMIAQYTLAMVRRKVS